MSKSAIQERISQLRQVLKNNDISAIIIPSADPHLSEYLPVWRSSMAVRLYRLSGYLVVTHDFAGLGRQPLLGTSS